MPPGAWRSAPSHVEVHIDEIRRSPAPAWFQNLLLDVRQALDALLERSSDVFESHRLRVAATRASAPGR